MSILRLKIIFGFAWLFLLVQSGNAQWTWMKGQNVPNGVATYGVQGVSNPANTPPGLYEPSYWQDLTGKFWVFGGVAQGGLLQSDMWRYDPLTNEWTWMKGPGVANQPGNYGMQGVSAPANMPGARGWCPPTWTDNAGNLWLFGGYGNDGFGGFGSMSDIWRYNIATNNWTWMNGPPTINSLGIYGTMGVQAFANTPPSRFETNVAWVGPANTLWFFGGHKDFTPARAYSDVWRYDIAANQWTWMTGSNLPNMPPVYGTLGVAAPANTPGGRLVYSNWRDTQGNLWLFGGAKDYNGSYNDLWKLDMATFQWTWVNGSNIYNNAGSYPPSTCMTGTNYYPSARLEGKACWYDLCDRFWVWGGGNDGSPTNAYNDLWVYDPITNEFTLVNGGAAANQVGVYGTQGVPNGANIPGGRFGSIGWTDAVNDLYLFAGASSAGNFNDMWRYHIDDNCPAGGGPSQTATAAFNPSPVSGCAPLSVVFNNTSLNAGSYHWDFGDGGMSNVANPTHVFVLPGNYVVTLIARGLGCQGIDDTITFNITANPGFPVFIGNDTTFCPGNTTVLNAGHPGATYLWSNGATTQTINAGPTATYWVQVTLGGCMVRDSINIGTPPGPPISINPVASQCYLGNSFSFTVNGVTDPAATYSWTFFPAASPSFSNLANPTGITYSGAGTLYAAVMTIQNGCETSFDTIPVTVVAPPNPGFYYNTLNICLAENQFRMHPYGMNIPGLTYLWSFPTGTPSTSILPDPIVHFNNLGPNVVNLTVSQGACSSTATVTINVVSNPTANAGPDAWFCESEGGAQLYGSVGMQTVAPYYYVWSCDTLLTYCGLDSVYDDDPFANPTDTTKYYLFVTDANGCRSPLDSCIVYVMPKPIANAGPDIWVCHAPGPCTMITAAISNGVGPYSLQWSPTTGLNNPTLFTPCARPDTTTIYTLIATDLTTGCTSITNTVDTISTVTVHVHPLPVANAGPDRVICFQDSIILNGTGMSAGPLYDFEWSPSMGLNDPTWSSPHASPPLTTEYILTVWSNGCPSYGDTMKIVVNTLPTVTASADIDVCFGRNVQLDALGGGAPSGIYTYEWTPTSGLSNALIKNPLASPALTGYYYVQSESQFGCKSAKDSVLVTIKPTPIPEAGPNVTICSGTSINLAGSIFWPTPDQCPTGDLFVSWGPNTGLSSSTILTPLATPTTTTMYRLTTWCNGCIRNDTVIVVVMPTPLAVASADTNVICEEDSVALYSSGGLGGSLYSWSPANGLSDPNVPNPMASPGQSTTYSVSISEGGCASTALVYVDVIPKPHADYLNSTASGCEDWKVNFIETSTNAINYVWNFGDGSPVSNEPNPTHLFTQPGNYLVTLYVSNAGECGDSIQKATITVYPSFDADFTTDPGIPVEMVLPNTDMNFTALNGVNSWLWDFGDNYSGSGMNINHRFVNPGTYYITLYTVSNEGCYDSVSKGPVVIQAPNVFIPNIFSPNADGVDDIFNVIYTGDQPFKMQIMDRWGVPQFETTNKNQGWNGTNKNGEVQEGVYFYHVYTGSQHFTGNLTLLR